jgi:hypothetical protein
MRITTRSIRHNDLAVKQSLRPHSRHGLKQARMRVKHPFGKTVLERDAVLTGR